jgi:hypothetical protein
MPAPPLNLSWFDHSQLKFGWLSIEGWVIYPAGVVHSAPADLTPTGGAGNWYAGGWPKHGYEGQVTYWNFDEGGPHNPYKGGGHIYYVPEFNRALNVGAGVTSLVGRQRGDFNNENCGYFGEWTFNEVRSADGRRFWTVLAAPWPGGYGDLELPWWHGKSYPEIHGRKRGRPTKPPAP